MRTKTTKRPKCSRCKRRPRVHRDHLCNTCRSRRYTEKHPERVLFYNLKKSAKRREKEFEISREYFTKLVTAYGLENFRAGRKLNKKTITVDRIDNDKGYVEGNLQFITMHQNAVKGTKDESPF